MVKRFASMIIFIALSVAMASGKSSLQLRALPGTISSNSAIVFWHIPDECKGQQQFDVMLNGRLIGRTDMNYFELEGLSSSKDYLVQIVSASNKSIRSEKMHLITKPKPSVINVKDNGAKGDGETIDTKAIQDAIDKCPPYGEVYFPEGEYLTGALFIKKNNISINISEGAVLKAVHNLHHFPLVMDMYEGKEVRKFSSVLNIGEFGDPDGRFSGIRVYGGGTIDNQGSILAEQQTVNLNRMSRSYGLPVINCDDVSIENIAIINPCTWNVHPLLCNGFTTYGCKLISSGFGLSNADGWDPDSSSDCYLVNSTLDGQDDNIAIKSVKILNHEGKEICKPSENIYVSHCNFIRGGGICIGVELDSGVRNVWIDNCTVENCDRGIHICSRQKDKGNGAIEDVHFRDILIKKTGEWGINVTLWYWIKSYLPNTFESQDIREIKNIYFDNVRIEKTTGSPIQIIGLAEQPIKNIHFNNVSINGAQYEVLLRHCRDIFFNNVNIGDRHWLYDDAKNVVVDSLTSKRVKLDFEHKLTDAEATYGTKALYNNLLAVQKSGKFIFGAQDATSSGYGWNDDSGVGDIERVTGKKPEIYCWDFSVIANPKSADYQQEIEKVRRLTCQAFYEGGIISYCWHAINPITGGSFYEVGDSVVRKILPGGPNNAEFKAMLNQIAEFDRTLIGKNGEQIPVIFRPWHEFDGDWFWWGKKYCSAEEFKNLYKYTVTYLRDTCGVHNFLYAFSPDVKFNSEAEYLERYPGDDYVDVIALDDYWDYRIEEKDLGKAHSRIKIISDYARKSDKVAAISETGQNGLDDYTWFTGRLLESIFGKPEDNVNLAYVAVWRNSIEGFWTPYKGHPATEDFIRFLNDSRVIMADPYDWTNKYFHFYF